jgi:hypothetical protein
MSRISPVKAGFALGAAVGLWHLGWVALVATGFAQALIDFVFRIHFIQPVLRVGAFDAGTAAVLVLVTFAVGFVGGLVFALIWNRLHQAHAGSAG